MTKKDFLAGKIFKIERPASFGKEADILDGSFFFEHGHLHNTLIAGIYMDDYNVSIDISNIGFTLKSKVLFMPLITSWH